MSFVSFYKCDHCGKKLDEMHDYVDYDINEHTQVDLCADCLHKLESIITKYLHREKVSL